MAISLGALIGPEVKLSPAEAALIVSGLTADSRRVKPGDVFFALAGTRADGANFIKEAVANGAGAVVASSGVEIPARVLHHVNPRRLLALAAARFYQAQPDVCVAVTGTNGKTSVVSFVRQIWQALGHRAASLGTVGVVAPEGEEYLSHTTPDPVELHAILARLKRGDRVTHLALEASSHGLAQYRLDGVKFAAGAFTNITRDHLDYHDSFESYFFAKMRLFKELLPAGAPAVIHADTPQSEDVIAVAEARGLTVLTVGEQGAFLRLVERRQEGFGQLLRIVHQGAEHRLVLPLAGDFQASNALVAAGLVIATGGPAQESFRALEGVKGAKGRLEKVATTRTGAPIFVDYAHTPDALETVLKALRPYAGKRLIAVFGCGGDRDRGKRPQMGDVVRRLADVGYVTDDNPRSEDPASIRAEIIKAFPEAIEIGDREKAIHVAVGSLEEGDLLLVAGKGHETGQTIGKEVKPFSDHEVVRAAVRVKTHG
jgi:UDP-N-acetylmuramoyl-L-alanyl-D-glutamate--2,6-diaminopimelate ligase